MKTKRNPAANLRIVSAIAEHIKCLDYHFVVSLEGDHVFVHLEYEENDVETGKPALQKTRRWLVEPTDSETKIVETCWAAVQRSMLHRAGENFMYRGARVYSPHFYIQYRLDLAETGGFDPD